MPILPSRKLAARRANLLLRPVPSERRLTRSMSSPPSPTFASRNTASSALEPSMTDVEDCLHANRAQSLGPYHVQLDSKGELMMQSVQMSQHTAVSMPSIMGFADEPSFEDSKQSSSDFFAFGALPPTPISLRFNFVASPPEPREPVHVFESEEDKPVVAKKEEEEYSELPGDQADEGLAESLGVYIGRVFASRVAFLEWAKEVFEGAHWPGCGVAENKNKDKTTWLWCRNNRDGTKDTNALRKCRWSLAVKPVSNSSKFRLAQVQLEHNEVYCVGSQVKRDEAKRMKKDNAYWQDKIILTPEQQARLEIYAHGEELSAKTLKCSKTRITGGGRNGNSVNRVPAAKKAKNNASPKKTKAIKTKAIDRKKRSPAPSPAPVTPSYNLRSTMPTEMDIGMPAHVHLLDHFKDNPREDQPSLRGSDAAKGPSALFKALAFVEPEYFSFP